MFLELAYSVCLASLKVSQALINLEVELCEIEDCTEIGLDFTNFGCVQIDYKQNLSLTAVYFPNTISKRLQSLVEAGELEFTPLCNHFLHLNIDLTPKNDFCNFGGEFP